MAFWNKFGFPKTVLSRLGDYREPPTLWWIDAQKEQQLRRSMTDPSIKFEIGTVEHRYWLDYSKANPLGSTN